MDFYPELLNLKKIVGGLPKKKKKEISVENSGI